MALSQQTFRAGARSAPVAALLRLSPVHQGVLAVAALGAFLAATAWNLWNTWAVDFSALYYAGWFYLNGASEQIYAAPPLVIDNHVPDAWLSALAATGAGPENNTYPFIYPPWVAALMAPVAAVATPQQAMNAALIVNSLGLVAGVVLSWRLAAAGEVRFGTWAAVSTLLLATGIPAMMALMLGQAQVVVVVLCLLAFERYRAGAFAAAGIALGLAACLKLSPLLLALLFVQDRNRRAILAFVATCGAILAASIALVGVEAHLTYLDRLQTIESHIHRGFIAYSIESFLYELGLVLGWDLPPMLSEIAAAKPDWIARVARTGLIAGLAGIWVATRGETGPRALRRRLLAMAILTPMFMPLGWAHYYLLAVLLLPALVLMVERRLAFALIGLVALASLTRLQVAFTEIDSAVHWQVLWTVPTLALVLLATLLARPGRSSG